MTEHDAPGRGQDAAEVQLDAAFLVRLARGEGDLIHMLVDPDEGESQVRLARIAFGVAVDQAAAHPVAHERPGAGVQDRGPYHEARNGVVVIADADGEIARQDPQYPGEGAEQYRCLQQTDPEVGRQFAEFAGVLVDALVRVHAHGAAIGQPERAARLHPVVQQAAHQAFAQFDLQGLGEPALRDVQDQEESGDQKEHAELVEEVADVAA